MLRCQTPSAPGSGGDDTARRVRRRPRRRADGQGPRLGWPRSDHPTPACSWLATGRSPHPRRRSHLPSVSGERRAVTVSRDKPIVRGSPSAGCGPARRDTGGQLGAPARARRPPRRCRRGHQRRADDHRVGEPGDLGGLLAGADAEADADRQVRVPGGSGRPGRGGGRRRCPGAGDAHGRGRVEETAGRGGRRGDAAPRSTTARPGRSGPGRGRRRRRATRRPRPG